MADKESPHKLRLEFKQLKKLAFSVVVFPQEKSESRQFLATSAWLVCSVQFSRCCWTLLLCQAFGCLGSGRGESGCGFSKQKVIKLMQVFSRWISWKGDDPCRNDAAGGRTELQVPQILLMLLSLVSRQKMGILEMR